MSGAFDIVVIGGGHAGCEAAAAAARQERLESQLRVARIDHLVLSTDRFWLDDLVRFVALRKARLASVGRR